MSVVKKQKKISRVSFDPATGWRCGSTEILKVPISRAITSWKSWIRTINILTDADKTAITACIDRMETKNEPPMEKWVASYQSVAESTFITEYEKKKQLIAIDRMIMRGACAQKEKMLNVRKGFERDDLKQELHAYLQWHLVAQRGDEVAFYIALRNKVSFKLFR